MIEESFKDERAVLTESAVEDPRFSGKQSVILQHIEAAIIVPLKSQRAIEGAIYLDSRTNRELFRAENLGPLSALAAFATLAIENARQYDSARRQIDQLKQTEKSRRPLLIGSSQVMRELFSMIDRIAPTELAVLIQGESGTGKELVAREIHSESTRHAKPFIALYCGNVSPELFESELFGHKKGSFTGAVADKEGLVAAAEGGTLFLDEVADIPMKLQAKLLRFLQDTEYRVVGDTETKRANVRIVAATNKSLEQEVAEGRFREDLFYRLFILPITAPPLRDRSSDIPILVKHFLLKQSSTGRPPIGISPDALRRLMKHGWPGNVRELENAIARAVVVCSRSRIEVSDILHQHMTSDGSEDQDMSWKAAEHRHILKVLAACDGNKSRAALELGISRRYLHYKLKEWGDSTAEASS